MTIYYNDGDSGVVSMENSSVNINFCDYQKGNKDIKNVLISKFDILPLLMIRQLTSIPRTQ